MERLLVERLGRLQKQRGLLIGAVETQSADDRDALNGVVAAIDLSERSSKKVDALRAPVYRVARQAELGGWLVAEQQVLLVFREVPLVQKLSPRRFV